MWGEKCLILLRQLLKKYRSIALNVEMLLMLNHLLTFTHLRDIADVIELIDTEDITGYIPAEKTDRA